MANFNSKHKEILDELLLGQPHIRPGKMFGFPAYYVGRRLAICLYEEGVSIKLPEERVNHLLEVDGNTLPFQPMGKSKMREWLQINLSKSEDYRHYESLFGESIQHVLTQLEKGQG
jgi:hypothetical protein